MVSIKLDARLNETAFKPIQIPYQSLDEIGK
jgi:hypothetical protein